MNIKDQCNKYMFYHVVLTMADGSKVDGIIEDMDDDGITILVGEDVIEKEGENRSNKRQYGYPRRYRRFRRREYPFDALVGLSLLLYPYIAPPYPYYPY